MALKDIAIGLVELFQTGKIIIARLPKFQINMQYLLSSILRVSRFWLRLAKRRKEDSR